MSYEITCMLQAVIYIPWSYRKNRLHAIQAGAIIVDSKFVRRLP
ncbi:hypothetical protein CLOL250_01286 [Clostridium sp. L2-50]|nr:hypothetical protein CLOL250_01286 [Clostridium sp. L2-50]